MNTLHNFIFNVYPYICLAVFFMGSLARFDRDQYTCCLLYTSPSPRDGLLSRMPSSA